MKTTRLGDCMIGVCEKVAKIIKKPLVAINISVVNEELAYYECIVGETLFYTDTFLGIFINGKYIFFYSPVHSADEIISMVSIDHKKKTISAVTTAEDQIYKIKV